MRIFGKSLADYLHFERGFLILILVVGVAKLAASLFGAPNSIAKFLCLTVLFLAGLLIYSVVVHTSGFGSYKQLLPIFALQVIVGDGIVIAGIVLAILTGKDNVFTAPEFSPGKVDGKNWGHVGGHGVAMIVLPLIMWALGSLIMLVTKTLTRRREPSAQ